MQQLKPMNAEMAVQMMLLRSSEECCGNQSGHCPDMRPLLDGYLIEQPCEVRDYPQSSDVMRRTAIRCYLTGT